MPAPTAKQIYDQVRQSRPRGWRWFTLGHAKRVSAALESRQHEFSSVGIGDIETDGKRIYLAEHSVYEIAEQIRTGRTPGAVGFGLTTVIGWLVWKLVETAVWWAIQWAWQKEWGFDEG